MSDSIQDFRPGESLEWNSAERSGITTKRVVAFIQRNGDEAVVTYGWDHDAGRPNRFTAPLRELSRPLPQARPWYLGEPVTVLKPSAPPSAEEIEAKIAQRREGLRQAHQKALQAQEAVEAARELADRANAALIAAQGELRAFSDLEAHAIDAAIHQITHGTASDTIADDDSEWLAREKAKRTVTAAQSANDRLAAELANANAKLAEATTLVRSCASAVVASLIEQQTTKLRELESQAAKLRAELTKASQIWFDAILGPPKLQPSCGEYLAEPPVYGATGIPTNDSKWRNLFDRLIAGETDAELEQ